MKLRIVVAALALAGCTQLGGPIQAAERLEPSSLGAPGGGQTGAIFGDLVLAEDLVLVGAHLTVAPRDAPARDAQLAAGAASGATALARDHWVLAVRLLEKGPGTAAGAHLVALAWNGAPRGAVVLRAAPAEEAREVELAFDLGPTVEASNLYVLTAARLSGSSYK